MQIQCRLAYHLALLRNRSLGEEEEEEEEEEEGVGQVGDGKRGGGFPAVLHFRRHPFDSSCPSIFIPKSLGIPSRASGEHPASIRRASGEHPASIPMDIDPGAGTGFPHDDDDDVK